MRIFSSLERRRARDSWALALMAGVLLATGVDAAERYWPPIVDPASGQHTPGRFVWGDLVTADVAAAADFYGKVFGWTFETYGDPNNDQDTYTLALADGLPIGGMMFDKRAMKGKTPSARWIGLISVKDVRAAAAAVTAGGGKVVYAPVMLGQRGETAVFQDPENAVFGVVNSTNGDPLDYAGDLNEWVWVDLWSDDVEKAAKFYRAVVGYETVPLTQEGPRTGVHLVAGGYARAGIMQKQSKATSSTWLPYIRVADAKTSAEKARQAGGKVLVAPMDLNRAVVAIVADPTGAPVGIVQLPAEEARP